MNAARRLVPLIAAALITSAGFAAPAAYAGTGIPGPVSGQASDLTPAVPGGYCYATANQSLCRRVLVLKQAGDWIYAGGIISTVTDRITGVTTSGFHNIFRFSASTHRVDTSWKPQFYSSAQTGDSAYKDSAVTGLAADGPAPCTCPAASASSPRLLARRALPAGALPRSTSVTAR